MRQRTADESEASVTSAFGVDTVHTLARRRLHKRAFRPRRPLSAGRFRPDPVTTMVNRPDRTTVLGA
jgi:hypothetical protein